MNIYVTGIYKGCGKTFISAGIAAVMQSLGYKASVYKPIQTGAIDKGKYLISPDLTFVKMLDSYITTHSTYMFSSSTLPVISAKFENIKISISEIKKDYTDLKKKTDVVIVEASSSLLSPLDDNLFSYNIPLELNLPVVFVINPSNDSVANYLSELYTAKALGLDILGVIINKFPVYSDSQEIKLFPEIIEKYSEAGVLGLIRKFRGNAVNSNILINEILNGIDIEDLFRIKIPKLNMY